MVLSELIAAIQAQNPTLPRATVDTAVRRLFRTIMRALEQGQRIELRDFGVLEVRVHRARTGQNPQTGEPIELPDRRIVHWRTSKALARRLNGADG